MCLSPFVRRNLPIDQTFQSRIGIGDCDLKSNRLIGCQHARHLLIACPLSHGLQSLHLCLLQLDVVLALLNTKLLRLAMLLKLA